MISLLRRVYSGFFLLQFLSMAPIQAAAKKSLADFGYAFNAEGKMRSIATGEPFKFEVSDSTSENQKHYEDIGEIITDHVYKLMDEEGLYRIPVPAGAPDSEASFVFSTHEQLQDVDKLMVIIHGSGVVRAGQWARSLIINHSLDAGTVLPYLRRAKEQGYEVVITNTNDNYRDGKRIKGSASPEEHASYVWKNIIQKANAKSIAVVAHSYGGHLVAGVLSKTFKQDFEEKVFAVGFTDSVHGSAGSRLAKIGVNFVSSDKPLGEPVKSFGGGMPAISAGTPKHEMTSYSCMKNLFEFLDKRYNEERGIPDSSDAKKQKVEKEL